MADDPVAALRYLREVMAREPRSLVRPLLLSDFRARAVTLSPESTELIDTIVEASRSLSAHASAVLVDSYLKGLAADMPVPVVDLLIVCPKPPELDALQVLLGRELGQAGDEKHRSGRHFFNGEIYSDIAGRGLTYTLVCLNKQTNMLASADVVDILLAKPARLAVLIGMAAGRPGAVEHGDVVGAEQVIYASAGTRDDAGEVVDPGTYRVPTEVSEDFAAARPYHNSWHEEYLRALDLAEGQGLLLPSEGRARREPRYKPAVVVSVEQKDETTKIGEFMSKISGDAKALEMEGAGFANACERRDTPWVVLRGISDFGRQVDAEGNEIEREKDWQVAATLAAATAFRCWITRQSLFFGKSDL